MSLYFTSDLHFGHRLVARLRGFATADDMDQHIRSSWLSRVTDGDDVWVLGDLSAGNANTALDAMRDLPGRKHLISGNHDRCHPMHRDSHKWQRRFLEVFESVQPFARRRIDGREVLLSHFPYTRDRGATRYAQYRLPDEGLWLLHGHTHGTERVTPDSREFHVGWDAWGRLVTLDEIASAIYDDDPTTDPDHPQE